MVGGFEMSLGGVMGILSVFPGQCGRISARQFSASAIARRVLCSSLRWNFNALPAGDCIHAGIFAVADDLR